MSLSQEDPVVRSTRREVVAVLAVTAIALTVSVSTCYRLGFDPHRELKFVRLFGGIAFPEWVFWGIIVPWVTSFVIGALFAFCWMSDADLGEELEDDDPLAAATARADAAAADRNVTASAATSGDQHAR